MKIFLTLFRKEIKNMYRELLLVLVLQIGNMACMFIPIIMNPSFPLSPLDEFISRLFDFSFFFYPALLVYSLYIEERTGTIYQMHSLPIKRKLLRIKFLVVLCAVVLIICVISVINFIRFTMNIIHNPVVVRHAILLLFYTTFINLCLVCAAWGIMQLVKKNRFVVGLTVGLVGYGLFVWLAGGVRKFVVTIGDPFVFDTIAYNVFTLIMGGIFCLIGLFFYERYSEI